MKFLGISITFILVAYTGISWSNEAPLTLAIFPYVSPAKLVAHQNNIAIHVSQNTDFELSLATAKNPATFIDRLGKLEYDLIYSPPHLARFAEKEYGYQRVVMTKHQIRGIFLVSKDSPYQSIADLKNRTISIAPVKTLLHQMALQQLKDQGLAPGQDIHIKTANTHNNAIYNLLMHDSEAALAGIKIFQEMPEEKKGLLRELAATKPISGFVVMARSDLEQTVIDQLQVAFLSFDSSPAGANYLFKGFKLIDDLSMRNLDPYSKIFE